MSLDDIFDRMAREQKQRQDEDDEVRAALFAWLKHNRFQSIYQGSLLSTPMWSHLSCGSVVTDPHRHSHLCSLMPGGMVRIQGCPCGMENEDYS